MHYREFRAFLHHRQRCPHARFFPCELKLLISPMTQNLLRHIVPVLKHAQTWSYYLALQVVKTNRVNTCTRQGGFSRALRGRRRRSTLTSPGGGGGDGRDETATNILFGSRFLHAGAADTGTLVLARAITPVPTPTMVIAHTYEFEAPN